MNETELEHVLLLRRPRGKWERAVALLCYANCVRRQGRYRSGFSGVFQNLPECSRTF